MIRAARVFTGVSLALGLAVTSAPAQAARSPAPASAPATAAAVQPASAAELARLVSIPYERFTLPNGLRVLVHTDRKAPIVAVSIW